jgi:hypothetical protein
LDEVRNAVRAELSAVTRSPWLDTEGAAAYVSCTPGTLKTWRTRGGGPRYHIVNQKLVRYHTDDLDAFVRGESNR